MQNTPTHTAGVYIAFVQLFFTLSWTVYAIYLPTLAAQAGLAKTAVIWLLMLDQVIFLICDYLTGVAADRVSRVIGRLGFLAAAATMISCLAFLALPFVASAGTWPLIVFGVIWAVTSSALRAPPIMLLGKYAAKPAIPYLASLAMLGYGVAGAAAPYLAVTLRDIDPRIPFALSSLSVALCALGLGVIERKMARAAVDIPTPIAAPQPPLIGRSLPLTAVLFAAALAALALGFQIHFSINSAPLYLRFATPADLETLMPVFWIGFNVAMFPAGALARKWNPLLVMGVAALAGAAAVAGAEFATGPAALKIAQFTAGAAWGAVLMSGFSAGLAIGDNGAEGKLAGIIFSALAAGTLIRMAIVAGGVPGGSGWQAALLWIPALCWAVAGGALLIWAVSLLKPLNPKQA